MKRFSFIFLIFSIKLLAQQPVVYRAGDGVKSVVPATFYFIDSTGQMTFEQVQTLPQSTFHQRLNKSLDLGDTDRPVWFRFNYHNFTNEKLYLMSTPVRWFDMYRIDSIGKPMHTKGGFTRPLDINPVQTNHFIFELDNPYAQGQVFIRLENYNMNINLDVANIASFVNKNHRFDLYIAAILGLMLAIAFYNLFLYFSIKDRLHLYYFGYVLASIYIVLRNNGLHHEFFGNHALMVRENNLVPSLIGVLLILFTANYLNTAQLAPKFHKTFMVLIGICLFLALTDFFPFKVWLNQIVQTILILISIIIFSSGVYLWYIGYDPAKFFVIAFGCYLLGVLVILLALLGVFDFNTPFVTHAYKWGVILEIMLFSFAIGHRMSIFKQQAIDAQALALRRSQENEELLAKNNELLSEKIAKEQLPTFQASKLQKLGVPTIEGVLFFPIDDIIRLEALGSYCTIHLSENKKIVASRPMIHFEGMLSEGFMRVHKSHVVNLAKVVQYVRGEGGILKMSDRSEVPVSRTAKAELMKRLQLG